MGIVSNTITKVSDFFHQPVRPRPAHTAYGFVQDIMDAVHISHQGRDFLIERLGKSGYEEYRAGLTQDERCLLDEAQHPFAHGDSTSLDKTLEGMADALAIAGILVPKLQEFERDRMWSKLAAALTRFEAGLPKK
jgi:hypothetical protein